MHGAAVVNGKIYVIGGGGIKTGQVIGATDRRGEDPVELIARGGDPIGVDHPLADGVPVGAQRPDDRSDVERHHSPPVTATETQDSK